MAKKPPPKKDKEKVHITVESWQWETPPARRFTWKHGIVLAILLAVAILLALGFILITGVILIVGLIINLLLYIFKKLS